MTNSNDAMYDPAFADHLKQVAAADGHEIGTAEDPNNTGGGNQNEPQQGPGEGRGRGGRGRGGRGGRRGRGGRGGSQPAGPQVDPGADPRAALIAQIQAAAGDDGNDDDGEGETGDA